MIQNDRSTKHTVCARIETVLEAVSKDEAPVVPTPAFDVVHVSFVNETILIAFRQPMMGRDTVLVYPVDFPPGPLAPALAEAVATENFLEDLRVFGPNRWQGRMLVDIETLTIIK